MPEKGWIWSEGLRVCRRNPEHEQQRGADTTGNQGIGRRECWSDVDHRSEEEGRRGLRGDVGFPVAVKVGADNPSATDS
jgi:hypothetical protein